jgi:hypothetical protein
MRWVIAVCAFALLGCDDDDLLYADGSSWKPVMPVKGPSSIPKDLREWDRYFGNSGIQADQTERSFTPTWLGFSVDPVGSIQYKDFGAIVVMWSDTALTGVSDEAFMALSGVPEAIRPPANRYVQCMVLDESTVKSAGAVVGTGGAITFSLAVVAASPPDTIEFADVFTDPSTLGFKGLQAGWIIQYVK